MRHEHGFKAGERCLSPGEYRRLGQSASRWTRVCLDAGEITEAKHQLNEAARFFWLADEIENERRSA